MTDQAVPKPCPLREALTEIASYGCENHSESTCMTDIAYNREDWCDRCIAQDGLNRADALAGAAPQYGEGFACLSAAAAGLGFPEPPPEAPGAVETPLVTLEAELLMAAEEMRRSAETVRTATDLGDSSYREVVAAGNSHIASIMERAVAALRASARSAPTDAHADDLAVDQFAAKMKAKLAAKREQGYGGWDTNDCPNGRLPQMLRDHVAKGDPVDIANLAMMCFHRGESLAASPSAERILTQATDEQIGACASEINEYCAKVSTKDVGTIAESHWYPGTIALQYIISKHFPARSGAAVVPWPTKERLAKDLFDAMAATLCRPSMEDRKRCADYAADWFMDEIALRLNSGAASDAKP